MTWTFSLALCLGRFTHIFLRAASFSSGVRPFLYRASASWYCGGRLTAMREPGVAARLILPIAFPLRSTDSSCWNHAAVRRDVRPTSVRLLVERLRRFRLPRYG